MTRMQQRRKTAASWTTSNEVLLAGEFGIETDTYKMKLGDGATGWNSLGYQPTGVASGGTAPTDHTATPLWVDTSQTPPVLKGWDSSGGGAGDPGAWVPVGGYGGHRTQQYWAAPAAGATPGEVRLTEVPQFGSLIRLELDGDVPGPVQAVIYRGGSFNRCDGAAIVPTMNARTWWRVGGLADPFTTGWDGFTVYVDGNGANAALVVRNYGGFGRHLRVYWSEV